MTRNNHKEESSNPIAVSAKNLRRDFNGKSAVYGLDLTVQSGSLFCFLGPNGAGKTSTVFMLLGLLPPTSGTASILGHDSRRLSVLPELRKRTGVVLDEDGLHDQLTPLENIELAASYYGLKKNDSRKIAAERLSESGMKDKMHSPAASLSFGEKKLTALFRAMVHKPDLLILDEPTAGLDPANRILVRKRLAEYANGGNRTVFMTTHDLEEAGEISTGSAIINKGKIVFSSISDLTPNPHETRVSIKFEHLPEISRANLSWNFRQTGVNEYLFTGPGGEKTSELVKTLVQNGCLIREVAERKEKLKDIYFSLTKEATLPRH
ncbi:MAG: ABC transporter ATP-binding protein [Fibrobacterota bacterium]